MAIAFTSLRKHPVIIIVLVILAVLLAWGFWPKAVVVEIAQVSRGPLTVTIEEEGRTRVIDRYVISAPVDGVACRMHLNVGDPVTQHQTLFGITPLASQVLDSRSRAQARAKVAAAESALRAAEQQAQAAADAADLAATALERQQSLLKRQLVSQDAVDRAMTEARTTAAAKRSADFMVDVAGYDLEAARTALEYSAADTSANTNETAAERVPVNSPINGKILKIHHKCEGPVATGQPLLEVGDPTALEVEVDVLSADAVQISSGMPVQFERWGGDFPLQGVVRTVEPVGFTKISALGVEEQRVLVISDFTSPLEQWQRLGDGYRVEAKFILWQQDDVLQIPASSLFRVNGGWAVFVGNDDRAQRRNVSVGQRNGLVAQITEGLAVGEKVINHPSDAVEEGTRVQER